MRSISAALGNLLIVISIAGLVLAIRGGTTATFVTQLELTPIWQTAQTLMEPNSALDTAQTARPSARLSELDSPVEYDGANGQVDDHGPADPKRLTPAPVTGGPPPTPVAVGTASGIPDGRPGAGQAEAGTLVRPVGAITSAPEAITAAPGGITAGPASGGITSALGGATSSSTENQLAPSPEPTPVGQPQPFDFRPITRVILPRIALAADVVPAELVEQDDGVSWMVPAFKAGHAQYTAGPGQFGNGVLFGHVTSRSLGNVFEQLFRAHVGDLVEVFDGTEQFDYRVVEVHAVSRTDVSVLLPTESASVSLITCTGAWNAALHDYMERLVVRAELNG